MRSLYHEAARNGLISEFPTDLAVRLLSQQQSEGLKQEVVCAMRLRGCETHEAMTYHVGAVCDPHSMPLIRSLLL